MGAFAPVPWLTETIKTKSIPAFFFRLFSASNPKEFPIAASCISDS